MKVFYFAIFLNYSNYFINPIVYALLIPEFRQWLILLCLKRQVFFLSINSEYREVRDIVVSYWKLANPLRHFQTIIHS